jgi:hypothetical protein
MPASNICTRAVMTMFCHNYPPLAIGNGGTRCVATASRPEFDLVLFWSLDRLSREGTVETRNHRLRRQLPLVHRAVSGQHGHLQGGRHRHTGGGGQARTGAALGTDAGGIGAGTGTGTRWRKAQGRGRSENVSGRSQPARQGRETADCFAALESLTPRFQPHKQLAILPRPPAGQPRILPSSDAPKPLL